MLLTRSQALSDQPKPHSKKDRTGLNLLEFTVNSEVTEYTLPLGVAAGRIDKLREFGHG